MCKDTTAKREHNSLLHPFAFAFFFSLLVDNIDFDTGIVLADTCRIISDVIGTPALDSLAVIVPSLKGHKYFIGIFSNFLPVLAESN